MGCEGWRLVKGLLGWKVLPRHPHTGGTKFLQKQHPWQRKQREFLAPCGGNPAWNFKNSCKMYILLYNQSCFHIKIKWFPLTPLESLSNIYIEARHPVFILWLCCSGMLPSPAGVCIPQFESSIISCMWIWIRRASLCSKSGHVGCSLSYDIN